LIDDVAGAPFSGTNAVGERHRGRATHVDHRPTVTH
jgi:hypothetical protein